jgi:L-ascorbate metabolism protein UlaG (beta-lactamase superfamily)
MGHFKGVNVAFLPIGDKFTMSIEEAIEVASIIKNRRSL